MSDEFRHRDALRHAAAATEPSPEQVDRLRRRVAWPTTLLHAAAPSARRAPAPKRRIRTSVWVGLAALPIAAALALSIGRPPAPLDSALHDRMALGANVTVVATGDGHVLGTERSPRLTWEAGTLEVDVTPKAGIDLLVTTPEAEVQVVGTRFTVRRDALGTTVSVAHGLVRVRCATKDEWALPAGEHHTCLPTRAAGLLGRARAQRAAGADADILLDTIAAGLALPDTDGAVRSELGALRIETLARAGRIAEARAAAEAWLATGAQARRAQIEALLQQLPEE